MTNGAETEEAYPYTSGDDSIPPCQYNKADVVVYPKNWSYVNPPCDSQSCTNQNETALAYTIVADGPVSVSVDADSWFSYTGGLFTDTSCPNGVYNQVSPSPQPCLLPACRPSACVSIPFFMGDNDDEDKDEDEDCAGAWMRWCVSLNRA